MASTHSSSSVKKQMVTLILLAPCSQYPDTSCLGLLAIFLHVRADSQLEKLKRQTCGRSGEYANIKLAKRIALLVFLDTAILFLPLPLPLLLPLIITVSKLIPNK